MTISDEEQDTSEKKLLTGGGTSADSTNAHFVEVKSLSCDMLQSQSSHPEKEVNDSIPVTRLSGGMTHSLLQKARQGDIDALIEATKLTAHYRSCPDSFDYLLSDVTGSDRLQASRCCKEISIVLAHEKEIELLWMEQWRRLGAATQDDGISRPRHRRRGTLIEIGGRLARAAVIIAILATGGYKLSISLFLPELPPEPAMGSQVIKPPVHPASHWVSPK